MKKKGSVVVLVLFFIMAMLCGCQKRNNADTGKMNIYCLDRDENSLVTYEWSFAEQDSEKMADGVIDQLKKVPDNVNYRQTIKDFDIISTSVEGNQISLEVSEEYHNMPPTTEILVRAALVRTLCQIEGIDYVGINCHKENLVDALGQPIGRMNAEQFVDNAGNEINSYESVKLALFFADESGKKLKKALRNVEYNSNISMEKLVVEQLIQGPNIDGFFATVNSQTKLINATVKDGICYITFDAAVRNIPEGVDLETMIYSIVNSLTELPNVNKVMINIDGEENMTIGDSLNADILYERNLDIVE